MEEVVDRPDPLAEDLIHSINEREDDRDMAEEGFHRVNERIARRREAGRPVPQAMIDRMHRRRIRTDILAQRNEVAMERLHDMLEPGVLARRINLGISGPPTLGISAMASEYVREEPRVMMEED